MAGCKRSSSRSSSCFSFSKKAKNRIEVYDKGLVDDGFGGQVNTWTLNSTLWAYIRPMSDREVNDSMQLQSRVTHKMVIRYKSGFKNTKDFANKKIEFDGRVFAIIAIKNLDKDLKSEGRFYQEVKVVENGAE
jgi:SPP1 family predicted phage head-tail adaptor